MLHSILVTPLDERRIKHGPYSQVTGSLVKGTRKREPGHLYFFINSRVECGSCQNNNHDFRMSL